jgi:hypothetical protein
VIAFSERESAAGSRQLTRPVCFLYAALLTFSHLARCAAAIRLRPAAEIVLFGLAVLVFAHRFFCARLILRRPAVDIVRVPFELLPNAASAASIRWSCCCVCSRSVRNCWTTADMCFIGTPSGMIAGWREIPQPRIRLWAR